MLRAHASYRAGLCAFELGLGGARRELESARALAVGLETGPDGSLIGAIERALASVDAAALAKTPAAR